MKNIFENIYFGKAYKTRGGHKALVWYYHVGGGVIDQVVLITYGKRQILVDGSGKEMNEPYHNTKYDIVSEWQEPIDEEKLAVRYYNQGAKETLDRAMEFWRKELDVEVDDTYKQWVNEKLTEFENEMKGE